MNTVKQSSASNCLAALTLIGLLLVAAAPAVRIEAVENDIQIRRLEPPAEGGRAVELTYLVDVPVDVFWRFKTDFSAEFLLSNRYITSNRVIARRSRTVITETSYSHSPGVTFRWQTSLEPTEWRLRYVLLMPDECGQRFNRGVIDLVPVDRGTRVTHAAFFDFFGATLWDRLPGPIGMEAFLRYTARWEQETVRRLQSRYRTKPRH